MVNPLPRWHKTNEPGPAIQKQPFTLRLGFPLAVGILTSTSGTITDLRGFRETKIGVRVFQILLEPIATVRGSLPFLCQVGNFSPPPPGKFHICITGLPSPLFMYLCS